MKSAVVHKLSWYNVTLEVITDVNFSIVFSLPHNRANDHTFHIKLIWKSCKPGDIAPKLWKQFIHYWESCALAIMVLWPSHNYLAFILALVAVSKKVVLEPLWFWGPYIHYLAFYAQVILFIFVLNNGHYCISLTFLAFCGDCVCVSPFSAGCCVEDGVGVTLAPPGIPSSSSFFSSPSTKCAQSAISTLCGFHLFSEPMYKIYILRLEEKQIIPQEPTKTQLNTN